MKTSAFCFVRETIGGGDNQKKLEAAGITSAREILEMSDDKLVELGIDSKKMNAIRSYLLTNKSHHPTGKNNIKPLITRMNTDMKKWARVHSLREWGRVKQKLCKQACKIFAFFC